MLQSPGVHLQSADEVVHVGLASLVVNVTASKNENGNKTNEVKSEQVKLRGKKDD